MPENPRKLVLEIFKHDNQLKMSVSESAEFAQTVSHYSQSLVNFEDIDKLCQEVTAVLNKANKKNTLTADALTRLQKAGQLLWEQLLSRSVKDRLKITIIKDLVLSIEEELVNIPWELLYDGNDFLGLKFNLGRLIRTKSPEAPTQYRGFSVKPKMLILANPTNDLKSAYLEGLNIKNQFDKIRERMSIDFKSTSIDTLYIKRNLREYDIVHFAGHCEYERNNPKDTGWILSDGRFTTQDILTMGENMSMPNLVFSNGCHTAAVGQDVLELDYQEKTYSLASAFLFSGVRHYIGAVQRIEDPVSFIFAKEFYTRLIQGHSVGECVRLSRLRLIQEYGPHSLLWASYILYGDPNFALFKAKPKPAAQKSKRSQLLSDRHKAKLPWVLSGLAVILAALFLYIWLPTINPSAYFLLGKAKKLFKMGQNQEAIQLALSLVAKDPKFTPVYPLLAEAAARLGQRDQALKYYFDYVLLNQKTNDERQLASAYTMIGWLYHQKGEYSKAAEFYRLAIDLSRKIRDRLNESIAMRKLAIWHMDKGEDDLALQLLTKSAEINRSREHNPEYRYNLACAYFDLGLLFADKDDFNTAKEFYNKSLALFKDLNLKNEMSDYYFNLGEIYLFEKQYQQALDNYNQGIKIDLSQGNRANLASDYNMLGELYLAMDNSVRAEEAFKQAEAAAKEINAQPELAYVSFNLGLLYKNRHQRNKAREYFRQAQQIYRVIDTPDFEAIKDQLLSLDE